MNKKPTDKQIAAWYYLTQWVVSREQQLSAIVYIKACLTRSDLSSELGRIRALYIERKLSKNNVFEAPMWQNFKEEKHNAK